MCFNFYSDVTTGNSFVPLVLHTLSLYLYFRLFFFFFFFYHPNPLSFAFLPPFIMTFFALISTTILLPPRFSGIFSFTLLVSSPPFSWNFDFWGLFVLFRLSHMHLMRQRLGKNPIINAEAKIFNLLACSGSFPWFQASPGIHTCIIRAPFLW